jgi:phospholipid/cholesterol/gamma-HCH transport system substrate-binding protein
MVLEHAKAKIAALIAFTVVCLLTFVYLLHSAGGNLGFGAVYRVGALMPDTFNLVQNSDVRSAGVTIGRVESVNPDGQVALVKFVVDKQGQEPFYRDATVQVRTKTLVGESYLDVNPGTPAAGKLPSGGVLPLSAAQQAVPLEKVLSMFDPATRDEVRRNLTGLGLGLKAHGTDLNELFGQLLPTVAKGGTLVNVLEPQRQQLAALIDDSGTAMQALGERSSQFRTLVVDAKATAEAVASRDAQLRATLDQLPSTLAQARQTVGQLSNFSVSATPVFRQLRLASADLVPAIRDLAPSAADARVLFRQLDPFLAAAQPLLSQLRPAATKLATVVLPLDAVLRQANPAVGYLRAYSQEFGSFFSNVNAAVASKDALGNRGRVFAIVGPNQLTNVRPSERQLLDAFISAGGFHVLQGTMTNAYPKPGTAGDPQPFDGHYSRVQPGP